MIDTVIHKSVDVRQTNGNFIIKYHKRDEICDRLLSKLEKNGWVIDKNPAGDVCGVHLAKSSVTFEDVKVFDKLAPYVHHNSSIELKPAPYLTATPSIWWFFERGVFRESHWGVEL